MDCRPDASIVHHFKDLKDPRIERAKKGKIQLSGLRSTDLQQRGDDSDQHDSYVIEAIDLIILKRPLIGFTAVNVRFPIDDNHDVLAFFGWLLSGPWIKACAEFMESRHDFVQTAGALMRWRCHILIFRHLQRLCI